MATLRDNLIFDIHDEDSPNGAALVRLTQARGKFFRLERNGTGSGGLSMALSRSQIQHLRKDRLVRVYYPPTSTTEPIGTFILQKRSSLILTKRGRGGRQVAWTGGGALTYLARARMAAVSYLDPGGMGPLEGDGTWRFHLQGSWIGAVPHSLGAYLYRAIAEATDPDRPQQPLAHLTIDFDASTDSNGNPWTPYEGEFAPQIGDSVLDVALELMKLGLWVEMEHNLLLHAYNTPQGRDLTGPAWAPGVVRFQSPTGRVVSTGNIKDELTSTGDSEIELSTELVGNGEVFGWVPNPAGANVVREGYLRVDAADSGAQTVAAEADMAGRDRASDTIRLRVLHGNDEAHGLYLFGTRGHASAHAAPGDLATLNAATAAEGGHVDDPQEIAAITWTDRARGPATDVVIDFGAGYRSAADRQGQGGGGCNCPPGLKLCNRPIIATDATWKALSLSYYDGASTVVINTIPAGWGTPGFDDSAWDAPELGGSLAGYDLIRHPDAAAERRREEYLLRKEFWIPEDQLVGAAVLFQHWFDDGGKAYVNGVEIASVRTPYDTGPTPIPEVTTTQARSAFVAGWNVIGLWAWNQDVAPPGGTIAGLLLQIQTGLRGTSLQAARCDSLQHASETPYRNEGSGLAAENVQDALDEAVTAALTSTVIDHGSMGAAETFDASVGHDHEGIQDANLTATLAGATAGEAAWMTLVLTQDGTGGRTLDLPGSVNNAAEIEAAWDTTANAVNILTLFTYDGGATWYAALMGGAGVSAVEDLTTVETDTSLVLAPDGLGGVEFREEADPSTRWEPVVFEGEIVFFEGDIVMHEVPI